MFGIDLTLLCAYIVMVALNITAMVKYQRGATDGYAYSYVQPDGPTFSVWGIIYTLLLLLVFQGSKLFSDTRLALCVAFMLNGAWLIANGMAVINHLSYWLAVWVLILYAMALMYAYSTMYLDYNSNRSIFEKICLYAPVSANLAWVLLASLLNMTNTLMDDRVDFSKHENITRVGGPDWAIGILGFAVLVAMVLVLTKSDFVYASVTIWALMGVSRNQTKGSTFPHSVNENLQNFAQTTAITLGVFTVVVCIMRYLFWPSSKVPHVDPSSLAASGAAVSNEASYMKMTAP